VFFLESSPRPIAFQAFESQIHEIPGQGFRELKERGASAVSNRDPPRLLKGREVPAFF
jgi:hypothetical protein